LKAPLDEDAFSTPANRHDAQGAPSARPAVSIPFRECAQESAGSQSGTRSFPVEFHERGGLLRLPGITNGPEIDDFSPVFHWWVGCRWLPIDGSRTEFGHTGGHTGVDANVCLVGTRVEDPNREPSRQHLARCSALHYNCSARTGRIPFMDDQITVRLPTPLGRTLRRTSRRLGRRPSHVVRMALEAFLQGAPSADSKRAERVDHLIGSLSSGIPDLAERHREYVLASLKHAR
jgi:hypothetical protein